MNERYDVMFYLPSITPLLTGARGGGGGETQIVLLAGALARAGVRVCVVAFPGDRELPTTFDGVDVVVRKKSGALYRGIGKIVEAWRIFSVVRRIDARTVVVRVASQEVGLVGLVARLLRRRFVYSSASLLDFDERERFRARDRALYRLGLRLADTIVVQTQEQVELCQKAIGRGSVLIRSIAEPARVRYSQPDAFLWIGRVYPNKRPLAYVDLARQVPEARFRMVAVPRDGAEALLEEVRLAAASTPNLDLLDPLPRHLVLQLLESAVAVVSTSEFEGMPNVFLEAWARGVPALTLSYDPDDIISREGLGGVGQGSVETLARLARELWATRNVQVTLSQRCRDYVQREHGADVVAAGWAKVLGCIDSASNDPAVARVAR
jgi:glycosyltransferase involved in cell wall biosynthesis